jgi:hypothetical protein
MRIDEFRQLELQYRVKMPKLLLMSTPDKPASVEQIHSVEEMLGVSLPHSYRDFLREYGGGDYFSLTVFSADPSSDFYLPLQAARASSYLPNDLLPISDDYCGGNYVLTVKDAIASERVSYWNTDGGLVVTEFETVLDFVAQKAFG